MVVLPPTCVGASDVHGSDHVQRVVRVARELPAVSGQAPRLYLAAPQRRSASAANHRDEIHNKLSGKFTQTSKNVFLIPRFH